jgi:hypothetical protein
MGAAEARKLPEESPYDVADEDDKYVTRGHSSAIRYNRSIQHDTLDDVIMPKGTLIQRRRSSTKSNPGNGIASKAFATPPAAAPARSLLTSKRVPVMAILLGMLVMSLLAMGLTAFASWWRVHLDDMQYGRPRTSQMDAVVGHGDSPANPTHFIFLNLNRHVEIIELPGGDAAHAHIYQGPILFGDGQDLTPVTGEIRDVNGDGKPDLIVHIQDQRLVLINDGTGFRPQRPGDNVNLGP